MNQKPKKITRKQQKEATRKLVLKTARELFLDLGYEKTTIRAIAKKAGIASGTALAHFSDKKSLLAATLYEDLEAALTQAFYTFSPEKPFIEVLTHICSAVFHQFAKTPGLSKILLRETLFAEDEWGKRIDMVWQRSEQAMHIFFENMKTAGQLRADCDCKTLARGTILIYAGTLVLGLKDELDAEEQTNLYRTLIEHFFYGHLVEK